MEVLYESTVLSCPVPFPVVRARLVETVLPWARRKLDVSTRTVSLVPPCDLSTEQSAPEAFPRELESLRA
jgi:hypothetical protein